MDQEEKKIQLTAEPKLTSDELEQKKEYFDFVKASAQDESYFKDAIDWYMVRYVNPLCDRTIMLCVAMIALVSLYFLYHIIDYAFPLVQKVPIAIRDQDQSRYIPYIHPLRQDTDKTQMTVDEAVAKYLLSVYVSERESYDYRKGDVNDVNQKFLHVKNTSSSLEYKNFQAFMSDDNPESPTANFGRAVYKTVEVQSVNFIKNEPNGYYEKLRNLLITRIPREAEIRFTAVTHLIENDAAKEVRENYLVKLQFDFPGLDRNAKTGNIDFTVTGYKLFKVK